MICIFFCLPCNPWRVWWWIQARRGQAKRRGPVRSHITFNSPKQIHMHTCDLGDGEVCPLESLAILQSSPNNGLEVLHECLFVCFFFPFFPFFPLPPILSSNCWRQGCLTSLGPLWNGAKQWSNSDHVRIQWEQSLCSLIVRLDLHWNMFKNYPYILPQKNWFLPTLISNCGGKNFTSLQWMNFHHKRLDAPDLISQSTQRRDWGAPVWCQPKNLGHKNQ